MKQKFDYAVALRAATLLKEALLADCERIEIAGSLRRKKPTVGDIEILYIPRNVQEPDGLFDNKDVDMVDRTLERMMRDGELKKRPNVNGVFTWGPKNKLALYGEIPVDFFATTFENWWNSLVIRTGSKETNLRLTTGAQRMGRSLLAYGKGVEELNTGAIIPARSEREVFELAGVPYLEPYER